MTEDEYREELPEEFDAGPPEFTAPPLPEPPPEAQYLPPEFTPLPEEFADRSVKETPSGEEPKWKLLLTTVILTATVTVGAVSSASPVIPLLPILPDIAQSVIREEEPAPEAEKTEDLTEPGQKTEPPLEDGEPDETEPPEETPKPEEPQDPFPGQSDAQLLCGLSPWQSGDITAVFTEKGTGWWVRSGLYGTFVWTEDASGEVSLTGSSTVPNISMSSADGTVEEFEGFETGTVYYADLVACESAVTLDRLAVTALFDNPFCRPAEPYVSLSEYASPSPLPDWMLLSDEELPANGYWTKADECDAGVEGISFSEGAVYVFVNGAAEACSVSFPEEAPGQILLQNEPDAFTLHTSATNYISVSGGLKLRVLRSVEGPKLIFWDPFAMGYGPCRVFSRVEYEDAQAPAD